MTTKVKPSEYSILLKAEKIDGDEVIVGRAQEWPDVEVFEKDASTAYQSILSIIADLRATAEKHGAMSPLPQTIEREYSGRFTVRVPKWLHRDLAESAQREDVSFNQYISSILAKASGIASARSAPYIKISIPDPTHGDPGLSTYCLPSSPQNQLTLTTAHEVTSAYEN